MPTLDNNRLLVATRKGLLIFTRNGSGWELSSEAFRGIPISYAASDPRTGTLWACLQHGHWGTKLHRSDDNGATWPEVPSPVFPEGSTLADGTAATVRYLWGFSAGGHDQPGRLYLGTEPGGLFRSDDDGATFQLVESLWNHPSRKTGWFGGGMDNPGIHSILVDPRDSDHVYVGISCGGVFETTDGGASWNPRNRGLYADYLPEPYAEVGHDPHLLVSCVSDPNTMWQQNHAGIFRSTNGSGDWSMISTAGTLPHFGFTIAADENDPDVAWTVPAEGDEYRIAVGGRLCVTRTEDGGRSWQTLTSGLPQKECYDIVFRHGLDHRGGRLVFGSTTGNMYASDDRGESWYTLGNHLPPIYSVRFG
jgi:hypothetical protein